MNPSDPAVGNLVAVIIFVYLPLPLVLGLALALTMLDAVVKELWLKFKEYKSFIP